MASNRWTIAAAVRDAIATVLPTLPVQVRRKAMHDKTTEQQTGVVIVPEKERKGEEHFGGRIWMLYPVLVLLVQSRGIRDEETQEEFDARDAIRHLLHRPTLSGAPAVFDCQYEPDPGGVDEGSFKGAYEVNAQRFTYTAAESRTG